MLWASKNETVAINLNLSWTNRNSAIKKSWDVIKTKWAMNNKDEDGNEDMTHTVERGIQPARILKNENVSGAGGGTIDGLVFVCSKSSSLDIVGSVGTEPPPVGYLSMNPVKR